MRPRPGAHLADTLIVDLADELWKGAAFRHTAHAPDLRVTRYALRRTES
jgi:hypothetical protein